MLLLGINEDGNILMTSGALPRVSPVMIIKSPMKISYISSGSDHVMGLDEDGRVYGYGYNQHNQLGLGSVNNVQSFTLIPDIPAVAQILCSYDHSIILDTNGRVYACGNNEYNQLGLDDVSNVQSFTLIPNIPTIAQIASGFAHTMLLSDSGQLYTSGANMYGEIGLGDNRNRLTFTPLPNTPPNITQIECGYFHTIVLTVYNQLYACGNNTFGQLGLSDNEHRSTFTLIPDIPPFISQISCGYAHTTILDNDGAIYFCGDNIVRRQQPKPTSITKVNSLHSIIIAPTITQITSGYSYTIALDDEGITHLFGITLSDSNRLPPISRPYISAICSYYYSLCNTVNGGNADKVARLFDAPKSKKLPVKSARHN